MTHDYDWLTPSTLWGANDHRQATFYRPALFEYNSDDFMEEFLASAAAGPSALRANQLQVHGDGVPNKLFLPIHGNFYLAAASLCCRQPGFPSREVRQAEGEQASIVLRKLLGGKEYAWVVTNELKRWEPLNGTARDVLVDEERLPVFKTPVHDGRNLYCGYLPTASSDTYKAKPSALAVNGDPLDLPVEELGSRFTMPLMRGTNGSLMNSLEDDVALTTSVYLLVELWEFLQAYLPQISDALADGSTAPTFIGDKAAELQALYDFLQNQQYKVGRSLAQALQGVVDHYEALNATGGGDLESLGFAHYSLKNDPTLSDTALQELLDRVAAALPEERPPLELPKIDVNTSVRYVLRFVYERPQCDPRQVEVSLPSQPFTFAPFFDPDAPARPVRIPLPSDVSVAGLRKFKKNVTFMMSDAMRQKMAMVTGQEMTILEQGNVDTGGDGLDLAFICSFSIQIIFIVAFMLLMIFVFVFNIIFWWIAFFRICLPVPKSWLPD